MELLNSLFLGRTKNCRKYIIKSVWEKHESPKTKSGFLVELHNMKESWLVGFLPASKKGKQQILKVSMPKLSLSLLESGIMMNIWSVWHFRKLLYPSNSYDDNFGYSQLQRTTKVLLSWSIFITLFFPKETCKINLKLTPCTSEMHIKHTYPCNPQEEHRNLAFLSLLNCIVQCSRSGYLQNRVLQNG